MSGHSKWATTKHKKAAIDVKHSEFFARLIKSIEITTRTGGGDPTDNPTLFDAIQKTRKNSVLADNITRAVKRGSDEEAGGADWQIVMHEGYGPDRVAFLVECLTDNRNRAASGVRVAFPRNGGNLADPGSVTYNFTRKDIVEVAKADDVDEDSILTAVLETGAEEIEDTGESFEICSEPGDIVAMRTALTEAGMSYDSIEVQFVAGTRAEVGVGGARKVFRLIGALEDSNDVQNICVSVGLDPRVAIEFASDED